MFLFEDAGSVVSRGWLRHKDPGCGHISVDISVLLGRWRQLAWINYAIVCRTDNQVRILKAKLVNRIVRIEANCRAKLTLAVNCGQWVLMTLITMRLVFRRLIDRHAWSFMFMLVDWRVHHGGLWHRIRHRLEHRRSVDRIRLVIRCSTSVAIDRRCNSTVGVRRLDR